MLSFYQRFLGYSAVGMSTFLLDLLLVRILLGYGLTEYAAIVTGFLVAVSLNFLISYHLVFKGTRRKFGRGYVYFLAIALVGIIIIGPGTVFLKEMYGINLYIARIVMGAVTGVVNFLCNNFFNFKMGIR